MSDQASNQPANKRSVHAPASEQSHHRHEQGHEQHFRKSNLIRIVLVALAAIAGYFGLWKAVAPFDFLSLTATVLGGLPIYKEALDAVKDRRMTMELSMTIALVAALTIGEFVTAAFIVFFVLIAEVLEGLTVERGHKALHELVELLPQTVLVKEGINTAETDISAVKSGEIVLVKPGARIPVDGEVVAGISFVDQSNITGESMSAEKTPGSSVFAGTVNQNGVLEIRVAKTGVSTVYGKVLETIEQAEQSQAPVQKLADRLAGYLVYFALICAALTFALTENIHSTISVIIVAGACGIAAGTPLALLGAIGRSARLGAIVRGGRFIEQLGQVDTVVFDKTGTLTAGKPVVSSIHCFNESDRNGVLFLAASAELLSEHPIAEAVTTFAQNANLKLSQPEEFSYTPGKGISCGVEGNTVHLGTRSFLQDSGCNLPDETLVSTADTTQVFIAQSNQLIGVIEITDSLRADSAKTIEGLKQLGINTILLTGDSKPTADAIADYLKIDSSEGDFLPNQKADYIQELIKQGHKVAMIGDGVNDAPALLAANVGVSVGSATDLARESADIVLIGQELSKFVDTLKVSKRCRSIIWFNFAGTLAVDGIGVLLAAFGLLTPLLAAFIHVASELAFILNSARLIPIRTNRR